MLVTKKCSSCGCWAVFEFAIFCSKVTEVCTHCQATTRNIPWDREGRAAHAALVAEYERLCEKYPQLREITKPGDHLQLQEE